MAKVTVLIEGYVKNDGANVQGTVTLVEDEKQRIIVDPGMTAQPDDIEQALKARNLTPDDIETVFLTHHHPDHTRYMGLFKKARVVDFGSIYDGDRWLDSEGHVSPHAHALHTPGHTGEDATLLVSDVTNIEEKPVTVAICHLWWYRGKDDDPVAEDNNQLTESRKTVLARADYVVPGHGGMFSTR